MIDIDSPKQSENFFLFLVNYIIRILIIEYIIIKFISGRHFLEQPIILSIKVVSSYSISCISVHTSSHRKARYIKFILSVCSHSRFELTKIYLFVQDFCDTSPELKPLIYFFIWCTLIWRSGCLCSYIIASFCLIYYVRMILWNNRTISSSTHLNIRSFDAK